MSNKTKNLIITIIFSLLFTGFLITCILKPQDEYSHSERRKLAQFPKISIESLCDKSFFKEFSSYAADQMPLREGFRKIKAFALYNIFMQKDNNDIYVVDNQVAKLEYPLSENSVILATEKINTIKDKYLKNCNIYCSIIPDKNYFLAEENGYPSIDYEKLTELFTDNLSDIEYIDVFSTLTINDYYNTDTHWDQGNITKTASVLANALGFSVTDNFTINTLPDYYGVYYGQSALPLKPDTITYLTNKYTENALVVNKETQKEIPVYVIDNYNSKDPYDIFLDGASPLIEIENPLTENGKELIIFRDSFASSLAPLLLEGYEKITLVDTRYIATDLLGEYIEFTNQDVLFIYNTELINNSNMLK